MAKTKAKKPQPKTKTKNGFKGGNILIIGGAEDKLNEMHILKRFYHLSGASNASVLIIPIASDFPEVAANIYKTIFKNFGIKNVSIFYKTSSEQVRKVNAKKILDGVTGVFLTGGDQLRLSTILGGTDFEKLLKQKIHQGLTIAGSSAGAASISAYMITRGEPKDTPSQDTIRITPGLGILENIIIDQHFTQRARINRLITAVSYNPKNLGIGIDENTAIHINANGDLEVLGSGTVTIIDGKDVTFNTIAEVDEHQPFSVVGLKIHVLNSSVNFNINTHRPSKNSIIYYQL
jgi:cyanophycinase